MDNQHSEFELVRRFVAGDDVAFDALYRAYVRPVHDYVLGIARNRQAAEDITSATFLRALEQRATLRDPAAFRGWLFRIAHNSAVNQVSRMVPTAPLPPDAPFVANDPTPDVVAHQRETAALVWNAASSLEPNQFAVLDLALRKGLSSAEIGEALGLSPAQASLALHRAREALGNAVRFLVVARRRRHCERLAELVPEGVRALSPEQRVSVDRHVRRCPTCQRAATALTRPAELFGAIPLVVIPGGLSLEAQRALWARVAARRAAQQTGGRAARHVGRARRALRGGRRVALHQHWLAGAAAVGLAVAGVMTTILVLTHRSHSDGTHDYQLTGAFKDPGGYTYRVSATVAVGRPVAPKLSSVPPHDRLVEVPVSGTITVTNTTPGHTAPEPLGIAAIAVDELYPDPSPLCPDPDLLGHRVERAGLEGALHTYVDGKPYCIVTVADVDGPVPGRQLAIGGTLTVPIVGGLCAGNDDAAEAGCGVPNLSRRVTALPYTARHEPAAVRTLQTPPAFITVNPVDSGAAPPGSCQFSADGYDGWVAASNRPIPGRCA